MTDITEPETTPDAAPAKRSSGRLVALGLGILAVVGGAAFAAVALANNNGNSPEDPVKAMFAAAQRGDALGVMEQLEPGERDALRGPLQDLTRELNRIGVLHDADLSHVDGVTLQIKDLQLVATKVRDDIAHVTIKNGTSVYKIDADKLPLGTFVRDLAGADLKQASTDGTGDLRSQEKSDFVTTIKRNGHWYVSIGYSVAESARQDQGVDIKDIGGGVAANGADSPAQAVRDLVTAGTKLDVRRFIELLPPDEMDALHVYAGMFITDADKATADIRRQFTITVPTLDLDSDTSGNRSLVTIKKLSLDGTFGQGRGRVHVTYQDGCFDAAPPAGTIGGKPLHICQGADPFAALRQLGVDARIPKQPDFSFRGKHPKVGIETVEVDGKWYVSPTRTVLDDLVNALKLVQPSDLDKGRDWVKQLMDTFGGSFSTSASTRSSLNVNAD